MGRGATLTGVGVTVAARRPLRAIVVDVGAERGADAARDPTSRKQAGSAFGQLALRRLRLAPDHASGCPGPQPRPISRMGGAGRPIQAMSST